jgi:4-amino-4-deoxy-L-arabinose transferase-like glycosyltransferase
MQAKTKQPATPVWQRIAAGVLLLWMLLAGLRLAWTDSMTTDEGIHVASGYQALTRHGFRYDPEHPFLFKYLSAAPLLLMHLNRPADDAQRWEAAAPIAYDSWEQARTWTDEWVYQSGNNPRTLVFVMRLGGVLCLVLTGWLVYFLGKLWFSPKIGLAALFFTAFNPTILAHGHLANNDLPVALAMLAGLWALWRYAQQPTATWAAWVGFFVGVAQVTKFSAVGFIGVAGLWLIWCGWQRRTRWQEVGSHLAIGLAVTWAIIWLSYGLELSRLQPFTQLISYTSLSGPFQIITLLKLILPIDYLKGILVASSSSIGGRPTYLLGTWYGKGIPSYFPIVYGLKTQLSGLAFLAVGAVALVAARKSWKTRLQGWVRGPGALGPIPLLALYGLIFGYLAITSKLNIGIRHVLQLVVPASFLMALGLRQLWRLRKPGMVAGSVLAALYAAPILPNFNGLIGYSNAFVPGTTNAWKYFGDSNLEWGEHARDLAQHISAEYPGQTVYVNYQWNPYALSAFGLTTSYFDQHNPPTGKLILLTPIQLEYGDYQIFHNTQPLGWIGNYGVLFRLPPG